jgi:hypothetical protein
VLDLYDGSAPVPPWDRKLAVASDTQKRIAKKKRIVDSIEQIVAPKYKM